MAGGDEPPASFAGMSKNQLYDIMCQVKTLIEQNQDQARKILIQNPSLTKALFQAQIMLGMVQPPQTIPNIQPVGSLQPQEARQPVQQSHVQGTALPGQSSLQDISNASTSNKNQQHNETSMPLSSSYVPPSNPLPSNPLHTVQLSRGHVNAQTAPISLPLSSQVSNVAALPLQSTPQPPSSLQPTMPVASTLLQKPLQTSSIPHLPPQPPLPSQPRPRQAFPQSYSHMGPNAGFLHQGSPQLHHSQSMFHSGSRLPTSMAPPFYHGQPPLLNQQLSQTLYQGGISHVGTDFNKLGSSAKTERGSGWISGFSENPGPSQPFLPGQMSSGSQPPCPSLLTSDMEKAILQQVMSLTPEQINLLPPEQRNQVFQLQQMLRQ